MPSKAEERRYLDSFLRSRPDITIVNVTPGERPDFLGDQHGNRIGIEVTRFSPTVRDGAPRPDEQTSLRDRTMALAQEAYCRVGGPPLHVHAIFNARPPLTKRRVPLLSMAIAEFLRTRTHGLTIYDRVEFDNRSSESLLPEIAALRALRVRSEDRGVWYDGEGAWVRSAGREDVVRVVTVKEPLVPEYRRRCDTVWLLIAFEYLAGGTHVEPPTEPVDFDVRTNFDRVFCLATAGDRSVEVPITPGLAA